MIGDLVCGNIIVDWFWFFFVYIFFGNVVIIFFGVIYMLVMIWKIGNFVYDLKNNGMEFLFCSII